VDKKQEFNSSINKDWGMNYEARTGYIDSFNIYTGSTPSTDYLFLSRRRISRDDFAPGLVCAFFLEEPIHMAYDGVSILGLIRIRSIYSAPRQEVAV
jgi:hypothetical protein